MKNKTILVVMILMFAVALGAGVVAGKLSSRLPGTPVQTTDQGSLTDVLHLNVDQRSKMQAIWEGVRKTSDDCLGDAKDAQKEEDDKIKKLLSAEQLEKYQKITVEYQGKIGEIEGRRNGAFKKAVDDSLQLMTTEQQRLYRQIVEDRVGKMPGAGLDPGRS